MLNTLLLLLTLAQQANAVVVDQNINPMTDQIQRTVQVNGSPWSFMFRKTGNSCDLIVAPGRRIHLEGKEVTGRLRAGKAKPIDIDFRVVSKNGQIAGAPVDCDYIMRVVENGAVAIVIGNFNDTTDTLVANPETHPELIESMRTLWAEE